MNEATDTIREVTKGFTGEQKETADALLASLVTLATFVKTSHEGLPDVAGAADAFDAVDAAAEGLRALVPALTAALDTALDTAVRTAKTAADSVPKLVLSCINEDTTLWEVLRLYKRADPDDADLKAIKMTAKNARVKLQAWWLTYNRDTSIAKDAFGSGPAAGSFALTLDDLCRRLKLWDGTTCCHVSPNCCCVLLLFHSP